MILLLVFFLACLFIAAAIQDGKTYIGPRGGSYKIRNGKKRYDLA